MFKALNRMAFVHGPRTIANIQILAAINAVRRAAHLIPEVRIRLKLILHKV